MSKKKKEVTALEILQTLKSKRIKWSYDKKNKEWWTNETAPYVNDGFAIRKLEDKHKPYRLMRSYSYIIGHFDKLSNAKEVARLLRHG